MKFKNIWVICLSLLFVGCQKQTDSVQILCPNGAPSLAFVGAYESIMANGQIDFVDGSDQLVAELSKKDSAYDVIVAPINLGASLIAKQQTDYRLHSVITWGNLYLVGTDIDALNKEGELALFGEGAVPQKIVECLDLETNLEAHYYQSATLVAQKLMSGQVQVGLLAEPLASATIAKAKQASVDLEILLDLQQDYGENGYPQAAIFVKDGYQNDALFEKIDHFTNNGYPNLTEALEAIGIETLGLPSVEITVESIERQNVHYRLAADCEDEIRDFLALFQIVYDSGMLVS